MRLPGYLFLQTILADNPLRISMTVMLICIALFIVLLRQTLDFSECVIEHIDRKAFGNLGNSIETISLKGNKLRSLQVRTIRCHSSRF